MVCVLIQIHVLVVLDGLDLYAIQVGFPFLIEIVAHAKYTVLSLLAIWSSACQNGGNCTTPNGCTCATGYNGSVCQDRTSLFLLF